MDTMQIDMNGTLVMGELIQQQAQVINMIIQVPQVDYLMLL